jgi:GNAT superfamily N-acetyltransferase
MTRYAFEQGAFCIDELPNQPQIAHCHSFFVHLHLRGKGLAKALKAEQNRILREQGYNYAQCTTAGDNHAQHAVLEASGWRPVARFENSRSGGNTIIWGWQVQ